jgi:hypothetical protein
VIIVAVHGRIKTDFLNHIRAHSVFAYLQSAAMGGYGVAAVNGIVQACAMISEVAITYSGLARRSVFIIPSFPYPGSWIG